MPRNPTIPLICNPSAGRGVAGRRLPAVSRLLADNGVANEIALSRGPGHIERLIVEALDQGVSRVVVAGGDGSVHEAVNGIMQHDTSVELGVIPIGTGNDFARACSIPLHWEHASALLADRILSAAPAITLDVGRVNERYFANSAGLGLDARVSAIANGMRLPMGDLVYLIALLRALVPGVGGPTLHVRFGNTVLDGPVTLASFANGAQVGGMFRIAPKAQVDDGLLDFVHVTPVTRRRVLRLLPKLLRGTHMSEPEVRCFGIRSCVVEADAPVVAHLDGEVQAPASRFEIELLPGALRLL